MGYALGLGTAATLVHAGVLHVRRFYVFNKVISGVAQW